MTSEISYKCDLTKRTDLMAKLETRAIAYLEKVFGRKIIVNPEKHEPGFYHAVFPTIGKPYLSKVAYLSDPQYTGGIPAIIDVTGDSDRILKYLN